MKHIIAQLSGQQERLATDLPYFKQQAGLMLQAALHLQYLSQDAWKQLLRTEPQLLPQLVDITAAALQQLVVHIDTELDISRTAAMLAKALGLMLLAIRVRPPDGQIPCPADTATLSMLRDRGGYVEAQDHGTCNPCFLLQDRPGLPHAHSSMYMSMQPCLLLQRGNQLRGCNSASTG
jgi:hypothetical protein